MKIVFALFPLALILAACHEESDVPLDLVSEPIDIFYKSDKFDAIINPVDWHERTPPRLFTTPLRPTVMVADFSTPYLARVTHFAANYNGGIHDIVHTGFHISTLKPLPPEVSDSAGFKLPTDSIVLNIGGFSNSRAVTSAELLDQVYDGYTLKSKPYDRYIFNDDQYRTIYFVGANDGNLDGTPTAIECSKDRCDVELTLLPSLAGLPMLEPASGQGVYHGAALQFYFHKNHIEQWPEIRRKGICFAALSIRDMNISDIHPKGGLNCADMKRAIESSLK